MNTFTAKLDIYSVLPYGTTGNQWDIVGTVTDASGFFAAYDTAVGDIIYIDGTGINMGLLRYKILIVDYVQTDFDNLYVTVQWDDFTDVQEPLTGFEGCVGREFLGTMMVPSASAQGLGSSFMDYIRNNEALRASKMTFSNRVFNGAYYGERDGFNTIFQIAEQFIASTLEVHVNGVHQNLGVEGDPNDYVFVAADQIQLTITPTAKDVLTFNYNKLL